MKILTEYLGAAWPQQFQGFDSLGYQFSAVGIGDTERSALDNAIDLLAILIPGGMPYEVEKAIRNDYGPADDTITALEAVDAGLDEGPQVLVVGNLEEFPYHYVGVAYEPD